ncbi:MAG TPA: hypothetical protein VEB22_09945 [Phycisphaerales bacterium]|nr:hypothetical protein [Phycisphaerales bacterium]
MTRSRTWWVTIVDGPYAMAPEQAPRSLASLPEQPSPGGTFVMVEFPVRKSGEPDTVTTGQMLPAWEYRVDPLPRKGKAGTLSEPLKARVVGRVADRPAPAPWAGDAAGLLRGYGGC